MSLDAGSVLLEAIEAMCLRREAKRGTTMRPASQARREVIASMRLLFVGRIGLQPANLRIDLVHLSWITNKNDKNQPFY